MRHENHSVASNILRPLRCQVIWNRRCMCRFADLRDATVGAANSGQFCSDGAAGRDRRDFVVSGFAEGARKPNQGYAEIAERRRRKGPHALRSVADAAESGCAVRATFGDEIGATLTDSYDRTRINLPLSFPDTLSQLLAKHLTSPQAVSFTDSCNPKASRRYPVSFFAKTPRRFTSFFSQRLDNDNGVLLRLC